MPTKNDGVMFFKSDIHCIRCCVMLFRMIFVAFYSRKVAKMPETSLLLLLNGFGVNIRDFVGGFTIISAFGMNRSSPLSK